MNHIGNVLPPPTRIPSHERGNEPKPEAAPQFVVRFPTRDSWQAFVMNNPSTPNLRYCRYGCGGVGWVKRRADYLANGNNVAACPCKSEARETEQRPGEWAQTLSPIEQTFTLQNWIGTDRAALDTARRALAQRWGMFTFWGKYGVAKTGLLAGLVNEARGHGIAALYKVAPVMLDELRAAYDSKTFDRVFEELCTIKVLAIDEMYRYKNSEWAAEKMFLLIDRRYAFADQLLTVFATNARPDPASDAIWSRMTDAARCEIIEVRGQDVRPLA